MRFSQTSWRCKHCGKNKGAGDHTGCSRAMQAQYASDKQPQKVTRWSSRQTHYMLDKAAKL